ncbi:14210_t:CDS:2, partial [Cetraspora pellucida]
MQQEIENKSFLGNLLDERHHDKMIQLNASLNEDQKKILQDLRKQHLALLINKNYDSLLIEIQQSKDIDRLLDNNYYINRINEVREEYLDDLIKNSENINVISSNSEILQDIKVLNQTLLTENRNLVTLENIQRQYYNNGLYDILKSAIENEKDVEKLKNTCKLILQELLNTKIQELQQPPKQLQAKRSIEEVESNNPTTSPDKANQEHNLAGTVERQIQDIINQYKKTLNVDDKRKFFLNIKNKPISDIIKKIYNTTKDKRSLLDVLYYKWVLGKDDLFLFEKNFKKTKIDETKKLIVLLNNYLYEEPRKKAMISKNRLKKHNEFRKLRKHPMIFVKAS